MTDEPMRRLFDYDRRRYWLEIRGADELICDFFDQVEMACRMEGAPFEFVDEDEWEDHDEDDEPEDTP